MEQRDPKKAFEQVVPDPRLAAEAVVARLKNNAGRRIDTDFTPADEDAALMHSLLELLHVMEMSKLSAKDSVAILQDRLSENDIRAIRKAFKDNPIMESHIVGVPNVQKPLSLLDLAARGMITVFPDARLAGHRQDPSPGKRIAS